MPAARDSTPGRRAPTMRDVAKLAGVSTSLVSLVMRGATTVSDRRHAAVLAAARELGYRPNAAARSLAEDRTHTVGVVIDDLHNPFFADVIEGIHDVANARDMFLIVAASWQDEQVEHRAIERFLEHRVDGIVLVGLRTSHAIVREAGRLAAVASVGVVIQEIDSIVSDDELGAELAVDHLVALGHRDIAHISGGRGGGAVSRRVGYLNAMARHRLAPHVVEGDYTEHSAVAAIETLLAETQPPTAIFAANDVMAVSAINRLQDEGRRVPDDISVVGYDNTSLGALNHISLTTINQPGRDMGHRSMTAILDRIHSPTTPTLHATIAPELIRRGTTDGTTAVPSRPR